MRRHNDFRIPDNSMKPTNHPTNRTRIPLALKIIFCYVMQCELKWDLDLNKLHCLNPRANYTDRATADVGEVIVNFLRIEGATWSAWRIPTAVFSAFQTGAATFLSSSSSVALMRLSGPRSRPTTFFSGSAGNRTRASGTVAKNSDH
jgi:hypothetical protein